jgi:glucokinase
MAVLAGDIGGTGTVLAIFESAEQGLEPLGEARFASRRHESLEQIISLFLTEHPGHDLQAACFGVAGRVMDGEATLTNLPWHLEERRLQEASGARRALLINDLEAAAYGMLTLGDRQQLALNPSASRRPGNAAVVAAGTGLGEALLCWDGQRHRAVPSEAGHSSFAPCTEEQIELLRYLRAHYGGRVSLERVLSGPGLHNIYRFVRQSGRETEPLWLSERMASEDPSAVIAELAIQSQDPSCTHSLELFAEIYGAEAGDVALRYLALGGVFIGGGIAPKILPALETDSFLRAYTDKGRFSDLVASIPVQVALEPRASLLGAAHFALTL